MRINLANVVRASTTFGEALAGNRTLGREDRTVLGTVASMALVLGALAAFLPWFVGWTVAALLFWLGIVTGARAYFQARRARAEEARASQTGRTDERALPDETDPSVLCTQ